MFLGPNAASPPKNTSARVDANVTLSTTGMPHSSNSMPMSRSIHGNAFSCPIATSTSSQGKWTSGSPVGTSLRRPFASFCGATFSNVTPVSLPFVVRDRLRHEEVVDRDALVRRVLLLPRRRLHLVEARAHDDLHVLAAQPLRAAAAVHRGVAAAQHDDALADARRVAERDAGAASRCRCGCSRRPPRGPGRRGRARAARRCRRTRRPTLRPAARAMLSMRCPPRNSTPRSST